jgi:protein-S-isoprenylcysteine O-methyltransferase Ste14
MPPNDWMKSRATKLPSGLRMMGTVWHGTVKRGSLLIRLNHPETLSGGTSLKARLARRTFWGLVLLPVILFLSAGTWDYWQAWAFLAVSFIPPLGLTIYFYRRDPELLERRLLRQERINAQKIIMQLMKLFYLFALVVPGLDYRFGWSHTFCGSVPWWLTLLALFVMVGCNFLFFLVMKANRFAASIIQVETGQSVTDVGPYHLVRHPMYLGGIVLWLALPLALGSYLALPVAVFGVPFLVLRLLNEEEFLQRELPGYSEYCQRVRYRLVPFVW